MNCIKNFNFLKGKFKSNFFIYNNSLHVKNDKIFFLIKDKNKKFFCEVNKNSCFLLDEPIRSIFKKKFEDDIIFIGFFNTSIKNSKKLVSNFDYLKPKKINKNVSLGFGDRIGIASAAHVELTKKYGFFPIFAQQSVREIKKTSKDCEDVLHNAIMGIFQEGYKNKWGADADHIRNKEWLEIMLNNDYIPYTMYTIDTYDYINLDEDIMKESVYEDTNFKERLKKSKKYLGKSINFGGYKFSYTEDNLYLIVCKYYKSLDFLKDCFSLIRLKNREFDFEPTFDEREVDTKPEDHFYIVSELIDDGVIFSTIALKFPGVFGKGADYEGDLSNFIYNLKIHNEIVKYFGCYKISLHSADDKFKIFKPFKDVLNGNFHIKTSGTTWMESLRTIAEFEPILFRKIFEATLDQAEENSADYYIKLDYKKISDLLRNKKLVELIDIKETRQLLHVSYGTIINKYKGDIIKVLYSNEESYYENILKNYKKHLDSIFVKY